MHSGRRAASCACTGNMLLFAQPPPSQPSGGARPAGLTDSWRPRGRKGGRPGAPARARQRSSLTVGGPAAPFRGARSAERRIRFGSSRVEPSVCLPLVRTSCAPAATTCWRRQLERIIAPLLYGRRTRPAESSVRRALAPETGANLERGWRETGAKLERLRAARARSAPTRSGWRALRALASPDGHLGAALRAPAEAQWSPLGRPTMNILRLSSLGAGAPTAQTVARPTGTKPAGRPESINQISAHLSHLDGLSGACEPHRAAADRRSSFQYYN